MLSSREIVELMRPRIPGACVDPGAVSSLLTLSERLPHVFSAYYLECRLSEAQGQVDFLACAGSSTDSDSARRIRAADERSPEEWRRDPPWCFTWDTLCRWAGATGEWLRRIPFIWLEFDRLIECPPARQSPSFGVCVDRHYPDRGAPLASGDRADLYENCMAFLAPVVPPACEQMLSASNRGALKRCFECLPQGGRMIHVSFMAARDPATIKLYVAVPLERLSGYLTDIEWPGSLELMRHVTNTFCVAETADDTVYLDLALDRRLLPLAAITFSQPQLARAACSDPRRTALLGLLMRHGLSTSGKCEALYAWPGSDRESHPSGAILARVHRWLDVKITLHPEHGVGAKAYLGFAPVASMF